MSETTAIVGLDIADRPRTLAEMIVRAGQAKALVQFAGEIETQARDELRAAADADVERAGGGGFSRTVDGVRATLTDPKPKPRISDMEAFGPWWAAQGFDHELREYVEVIDHDRARAVLQAVEDDPMPSDPADAANGLLVLADCLAVRTEYVLPAKPLDLLESDGRCVVRLTREDDGTAAGWVFMDVLTGEQVPGVDVDPPGKPALQVVPDKQARARDGAIVRSFFGMPVQIGGGR